MTYEFDEPFRMVYSFTFLQGNVSLETSFTQLIKAITAE